MKQTELMGILNVTPNSFSDGGRFDRENIVEVAGQMLMDGATILDIGGESTAPTGVDVSVEEELARVIPVIDAIRVAYPDAVLSIDTWKSEVARAALERGVKIVNDVTAGRGDPRIAGVAAEFGATYLMMFSKDATPRTTREPVTYTDVVASICEFLTERMAWARAQGVQKIWVDPGMGAFVSGIPDYSFEIIDRIEEFDQLGVPVVVGPSKKGFLGEDREGMTLALTLALQGRVDLIRVHDVLENATVAC